MSYRKKNMDNHVMAEIPGGASESKGTFIKHVFNSNPESNAEFLNVVQYLVC